MDVLQRFSDVDLIGFDVADQGIVEVRIAKTMWLGEEIIRREPHRAVFPPDIDTEELLQRVNLDLEAQQFPALSSGDMDDIRATIERRRTPERLARYLAANPKPEDGGELITVGPADYSEESEAAPQEQPIQ